jgi:hypothetical protein
LNFVASNSNSGPTVEIRRLLFFKAYNFVSVFTSFLTKLKKVLAHDSYNMKTAKNLIEWSLAVA